MKCGGARGAPKKLEKRENIVRSRVAQMGITPTVFAINITGGSRPTATHIHFYQRSLFQNIARLMVAMGSALLAGRATAILATLFNTEEVTLPREKGQGKARLGHG
jgi:hypothetical protein